MAEPSKVSAHPEHLRRLALRRAPGAPWVTFYDATTGGRVELSATTLDNWVAKAGNLLGEEYDIGPGSVVGIDLDCHWLLHVWTWATWAIGASVALPTAFTRADVAVVQAQRCSGAATAAPLLACSSDPMARPLGALTPPGAADVMADVHTYPDAIALPAVDTSAPVLKTAAGTLTGAEACRLADGLMPADARRVLVRTPPIDQRSFLAATLSAATHDGSTVLVAGPAADGWLARITSQEAVDAELGNPEAY